MWVVSGSTWVSMIKRKPLIDRNDLKPGTVVVLDTRSKLIDFEFKRSKVRGTGSLYQNKDFYP